MPNIVAPTLAFLAALTAEPPLVAPEGPKSPEEQRKLFRLPPGFEIELIAAEPVIRKPMNLAFDRRGRLFATQSTEYPFPAKDGAKPRDTVQVFTDTDNDGVPDKASTFADGLNIPIGVCPLPDGALVYSIPRIQRFTQVDANGKATKREPSYGQFGFRDTHGMASSFTRWIDGWIYACHGFANDSDVKGKAGDAVKMNSGNTYRIRPDGAEIQQWTWGQVNPFGMCFDGYGELFTADCHTKPAYQLLRGAYYPSFGKPHDGLGFGPELMQHLHGSTGIAGVVRYEADQFPEEYRHDLFIGNPVTGRINRDRIAVHGSTYRAVEAPDFLSCDDLWFRPVDVKLAPDGSLYIADFYNCMIGHYEVPLLHPRRDRERGRIWRVSYKGTGARRRPTRGPGDLTTKSPAELFGLLASANITVRVQATNELVDRFGKDVNKVAVEKSRTDPNPFVRAHAMWVAERTGGEPADAVKALTADVHPLVRTHLVRLLGERESLADADRRFVQAALGDGSPFVQRAAADALANFADAGQVSMLLEAWKRAPAKDECLIHTLRMTLRDHLVNHPQQFATKSRADAEKLADVYLGVPRADAADFIVAYLQSTDDRRRLFEHVKHATHLARLELTTGLHGYLLGLETERASLDEQRTAARAHHEGLTAKRGTPSAEIVHWFNRLAAAHLASPDVRLMQEGLDAIRDLKLAASFAKAAEFAKKDAKHPHLRTVALDALAAADAPRAVPVLSATLADAAEPLEIRLRAADKLAELAHLPESQKVLVAQLPTAPRQLAVPLARGLARHDAGAGAFAKLLEERKASPYLLQDPEVRNNLKDRKIPGLDKRIEAWVKELPSEDVTIARLMEARRNDFHAKRADATAGAVVFTKHCGTCHQVANKGAKVGPQLDGVGVRGLERLLEDTLAPNRNVDHAFRAAQLVLDDGRSLTGLVLREEGAAVVLADAQGKEQRIDKAKIETRKVLAVSPMPNDVASRLPADEFRNLMAYLLAQKQALPAK